MTTAPTATHELAALHEIAPNWPNPSPVGGATGCTDQTAALAEATAQKPPTTPTHTTSATRPIHSRRRRPLPTPTGADAHRPNVRRADAHTGKHSSQLTVPDPLQTVDRRRHAVNAVYTQTPADAASRGPSSSTRVCSRSHARTKQAPIWQRPPCSCHGPARICGSDRTALAAVCQ